MTEPCDLVFYSVYWSSSSRIERKYSVGVAAGFCGWNVGSDRDGFHTSMFFGLRESEWIRIEGIVANEQNIYGKGGGKAGQKESGPGPETKAMAKASSPRNRSDLDVL